MKKALEFNETEYSGRTIYVSKAGDREGRRSPLQCLMNAGPLPSWMEGKGKGKDGKGKDGKGGLFDFA